MLGWERYSMTSSMLIRPRRKRLQGYQKRLENHCDMREKVSLTGRNNSMQTEKKFTGDGGGEGS